MAKLGPLIRSTPLSRLMGLGLLALGLAWTTPARADLVHLVNGKVLRGEVVSMDDEYIVVKMPYGEVKLRASQVDYVERQSKNDYLIDLGKDQLHKRRYPQAIASFEEAFVSDRTGKVPRFQLTNAYREYAQHLQKTRRLTDALRYYEKVLKLAPEDEQALAARQVIARELQQLQGLVDQAVASLKKGDLDAAAEEFERALQASPDMREKVATHLGQIHARRAEALYRQGLYAAANETLERAFSLDPTLADPLERLYTASSLSAILGHIRTGHLTNAKRDIARVLTFSPTNREVLYIAGRLEEALGQWRNAGGYYALALQTRVVNSNEKIVATLRAGLEKKLGIPDGGRQITFSIEPADMATYAGTDSDTFQQLETAHFVIYHYNQKLAQEAAGVLEAHRARIGTSMRLPVEWIHKPKVYLHRSQQEYIHATKQPQWSGGISRYAHLPSGKLTKMEIHSWQTSPRLLKSVIPHEVAHLVVNANIRNHTLLPRALHEGLAVLMEPSYRHQHYTGFLRIRMKSKDFIPLKDLLDMSDYPGDTEFFYAEGFALVAYLVAEHGMEKAMGLIGNAGKHSTNQELLNITGFRTMEQLEDDWKDWLLNAGR